VYQAPGARLLLDDRAIGARAVDKGDSLMTVVLEERFAAPTLARSGATRSAVLLDPQPILLESLERLLERVGVTTVSRCTEARDALAAVRDEQPDLLLVGLHGTGEVECIREAGELAPGLKTLVLADTADETALEAAFRAGASIAISQAATGEDVALAVRQAFAPSIFLARSVRETPAREQREAAEDAGLTKREREILRLVSEGYSNGRVARLLWVTEQTVKFHLSNIYRKLDVANRTEASRWAQRHGLLTEPPVVEAVA
jgi:DNA-binding NarL/FixJ family response regulator